MSDGQESSQGTPAKRFKQTPAHPPQRTKPHRPSSNSRYFLNPIIHKEFIDCCASRKVCAERQVCAAFLEELGWPYIETLKDWGWWDFITSDRDIFIDAVRVCYFHGDARKRNEDGNTVIGNSNSAFWTRVFGKNILIDREVVRDTIGETTRSAETSIPKNFDYVRACQLIYDKPELTTTKHSIIDLPIHHRILHLIVCQVLTPRSGTFTSVTKEDMYWMFMIITGDPIDLSARIVAEIISTFEPCHDKKNEKCVLPYAKLISQIIDDSCTVGDKELVDKECKMKPLDKSFLTDWTQDEETKEWRRKKVVEAEQEARALEAEPTIGNILDELRLMHWTNQDRFDEVDRSLGVIAARQTALETRQSALETRQANLEELLKKSNEDI